MPGTQQHPGAYQMTVPIWVLAVLTRSWRSILFFTLVGLLIAGIAITFMSPQYRISASLLFKIGREQLPPPVMPRDVLIPSQQRAEDMVSKMEMLSGQPLITEVVDTLGVGFFLYSPTPNTFFQHAKALARQGIKLIKGSAEEVLIFLGLAPRLSKREKIIDLMVNSFSVDQVKRSDVVQIDLLAEDPHAGTKVLNTLIERFLIHNVELYRTPQALEFFESQANLLQMQLKALDTERLSILSSSSSYGFSDRKRVLVEQERDIQLQLAGVTSEISRLDLEIPGMQRTLESLPEQQLSNRVMHRPQASDALELRMAELLARQESRRGAFENDSRPVREADNEIARIKQMYISGQALAPQSETYESNATYRHIHRELLAKQDTRTGLSGKERRLREEMVRLGRQLEITEVAGDRLHRLEREISNLEQSYQLYKKKIEEVRISDAMDLARISSVSVLKPTTASIRPVKPAKYFILAAGSLMGLLMALAYNLLREAYRPTVHSRNDVIKILGAPVLAEIEEA